MWWLLRPLSRTITQAEQTVRFRKVSPKSISLFRKTSHRSNSRQIFPRDIVFCSSKSWLCVFCKRAGTSCRLLLSSVDGAAAKEKTQEALHGSGARMLNGSAYPTGSSSRRQNWERLRRRLLLEKHERTAYVSSSMLFIVCVQGGLLDSNSSFPRKANFSALIPEESRGLGWSLANGI